MSKHASLDAPIEEVLRELEAELEGETEKLSYKWVVSRRLAGEGWEIDDSLTTGEEKHTKDDALFRQSAVIQMAYKTLKN